MPTHLYCLLPRGSSAIPPEGVRVVDSRAALAWVGDTHASRVSRDAREAVRATIAHDRVVGAALGQDVTPMPASLADPYDDDATMLDDLTAHAGEIARAFPAILGMVEMTTIIALNDTPPAADAPGRGTAYLEQVRSAPARAAAIADRVAEALGKRIADTRRRDDGARVALSHLVPKSAETMYRELVAGLGGQGYRLVVDGPRAPYSFALYSPRRGLVTELWLGGTILAT